MVPRAGRSGLVLILLVKDYFPRRVVLEPVHALALAGIIFLVCIAASGLGVRAAIKVDPATALGRLTWRWATSWSTSPGIAKHFGEGETRVDALRAVDLQVKAGEVVALLGPSGSGKTTLLNIIGCIIEPSAGRVELDGEPVFDGRWLRRDLRRLRLDKIGFIFQSHNLLPFLTAEDNVAVVLDLAGLDGRGRPRAGARAAGLSRGRAPRPA